MTNLVCCNLIDEAFFTKSPQIIRHDKIQNEYLPLLSDNFLSFNLSPESEYIIRLINFGSNKFTSKLINPFPTVDKELYDLSALYDKAWLTSLVRPEVIKYSKSIHVVDLFAGCGGLSVGVQDACYSIGMKFKAAMASDIDESALDVYSLNLFPEHLSSLPIESVVQNDFYASMTKQEKDFKIKCGLVDFLIGGPPCQGHSDLNNHTRRNDPRNILYSVMSRAAKILQPRFVIIENVPGVRHSVNGIVQTTNTQLIELGYKTQSIMLNAVDFGVPQNRKRHFTVATYGDTSRFLSTIEAMKTNPRPVMWAIDDLIDEADLRTEAFYTSASHSNTNKCRINYLFDNSLYELPDEQRPDCHRLKVHAYRSVYGRMRPDSPAPTITSGFGSTGQGRFVHPFRRRTLTPHEAGRVQFFPDWFSFSGFGRRKLQQFIGNAVPPKLGQVLAIALLNTEDGVS